MNFSNFSIYCIKRLREFGYDSYFVGGCVRDHLLCIKYNDIDIATDAEPQKVIGIFSNNSKFTVLTHGVKHGTVSIVDKHTKEVIEITTYRVDGLYNDNRHPDSVRFVKSLMKDLSRRDLTINSIAFDPINRTLVDYFKGAQDLRDKIVRFVGYPDIRIREDSLRMMRAIRFCSQLGFKIDLKSYESTCNNRDLIKNISTERINSEIVKIIKSPNPRVGVSLLLDSKLLKSISELTYNSYITGNKDKDNELNIKINSMIYFTNYIDRLKILFDNVESPEDIKSEMQRLRFSNEEIKEVYKYSLNKVILKSASFEEFVDFFIKNKMTLKDVDSIILIHQAINFFINPKQEIKNIIKFRNRLKKGKIYSLNDIPITGYDILELNLQVFGSEHPNIKGKEISLLLNDILRHSILNKEKNKYMLTHKLKEMMKEYKLKW